MGNEVTIYDGMTNPLLAIEKIGKLFGQSGMFGCKSDAQGAVLAMAAMMEKKNPIELMRTFHIIDGKLSMRADAMLAELRQAGGEYNWISVCDDVKFDDRTRLPVSGEAVMHIKNKKVEGDVKYTIADALHAGLVKPNGGWQKNPDAMLRARVISKAMRMYAPEVVAGYYTPEEVSDFAPEQAVKPLFSEPVSKSADEPKAKPAPAIEAKQADKPVQAKVEPPKASEPPKTAPAPAAAPATAAPVAESKPAEVVAEPVAAAEADSINIRFVFDDFCKPNAEKVNVYLIKTVKWITEGQTYMNLQDAQIERLMKNQKGFLSAVEKYAPENGVK